MSSCDQEVVEVAIAPGERRGGHLDDVVVRDPVHHEGIARHEALRLSRVLRTKAQRSPGGGILASGEQQEPCVVGPGTGYGAWLADEIQRRFFDWLDQPVQRVTGGLASPSISKVLERAAFARAEEAVAGLERMEVGRDA